MKEPNEALAPEAPPGTPEANLSGPAKPEKSPLLREVRSLAVRLAVFAAVLWVLLTQVYLVTQASGSEMFRREGRRPRAGHPAGKRLCQE